jgi:23S rRNA pseudouridine1911/1915/1917 synthase
VLPPLEQPRAIAQPLPLEIVYEDRHLLVVNKAAGMVVHPAPGHYEGTLVNALLHHVKDLSGIGGALRPGIVHRLDRDTSGLLVVAKDDATHQALSDALRRRKIRRLYRALSWGHLTETPRTVDAPLGRDPRDRKRMTVREDGRRAVTHLRVRAQWETADLVDVALETGRTHQIRVHLAHLGHPVVGDPLYGAGWERGMGGPARAWAQALARRVPRQFLHARRLQFRHPATGEVLTFESPLPEDLAAVVRWAQGGLTAEPEGA